MSTQIIHWASYNIPCVLLGINGYHCKGLRPVVEVPVHIGVAIVFPGRFEHDPIETLHFLTTFKTDMEKD